METVDSIDLSAILKGKRIVEIRLVMNILTVGVE
jgi:hypothetical protein